MKRKNFFHLSVRLFLLSISLAGCAPAPESLIQPTSASTPTVDHALFPAPAPTDSVSTDEAPRRSSLDISDLDQLLQKQETATFAGLWIQNVPEYHVYAAFTHDGQKTIQPYLENTDLEGVVEVRTAKFSLAELKVLHEEVRQLLDRLQLDFASGLDLAENKVRLYVTDLPLLTESLEQAGLPLPEYVKIIVTYEPLGDDLPFALTPVAGVFMPQLRVRDPHYMLVNIYGTLVVEDGCLRVIEEDGRERSFLIIWQADYFLNDNHGTIEVLNRDGQVVARVGDKVTVAEASGDLDSPLREPLPSQCPGPYYVVMYEISSEK